MSWVKYVQDTVRWVKGLPPLDRNKPYFGLIEQRKEGYYVHEMGRYFHSGGGHGYNGKCRSEADGSEGGDGMTLDQAIPTVVEHPEIPEGVTVITLSNGEQYWFDSQGKPAQLDKGKSVQSGQRR